MENLNDAEFGSNKDGEEAPILVAQRFLNIFRQVHIFNKAKRDQFDDELLALPTNISDFFKKMPGGRLLVEHIEEVKTERGISFVKSNKEDFTGGYGGDAQSSDGAPQPAAGGAVVGGNLVLGESFAETFSKSMAEAFKQLPTSVSGAPISGGNVSVDLGNAFDVLAEEIRTSRASLLDVLKETRSITDSVIASQVSISRILEGILSARSRDENDVANLNNRIIASQASISKLLESLYTNNSAQPNITNSSNIDIEDRLQDFKREIKQELDSSINKIQELIYAIGSNQSNVVTSKVAIDNSFETQDNSSYDVTNTKKKKKKNKKGNQTIETTVSSASSLGVSDVITDDFVLDEGFAPIGGTIRNDQYKHHDNFDNINLNEPPFGEDINENMDEDTVDDLDFSLPEQSFDTDIEEDNTPFPIEEEGLDSFDNDDLEFTLPDEITSSNYEDKDNSQEHVSFDSFEDSDLSLQSEELNDDEDLSDISLSFDDMLSELSEQTNETENETENANVFEDINLDSFSNFDNLTEATDIPAEDDNVSSINFDDNVDFSEIQQGDEEISSFESFDLSDFEDINIENDNTSNLENAFEDISLDDNVSINLDEENVEDSLEEVNTNEGVDFSNNFNDVELDSFTTDKSEETDFNFDDLISTSIEDTTENTEQDNQTEETLNSIDFSSFEEDITPISNEDNMSSTLDDLTSFEEDTAPASNEDDVSSTLNSFSSEEIEKGKIISDFNTTQSRYSAELDKIREALTSDSIDLSSLDEPIALDEYSDDENLEDNTLSTDSDEWEYEYVDEDNSPEQITNYADNVETEALSNEEWEYVDENGNIVEASDGEEWEYVDENGNSIESLDDTEWEYVDENGNPVNPSDNEEWEWEYVEEEETDNNKQ